MKILKTRTIVLLSVSFTILVFIIWMFGTTGKPTDKIYSVDKQYSFYLVEYNYNKMCRYIPIYSDFYTWKDVEYKVFVYDEKEQELLLSRHLGEIYWNDNYGFDNENDKFYFDKGDSYTLPRPIDKEILLKYQREEKRKARDAEWAKRDSEVREKFDNSPFISTEDIAYIKPVIHKWLNHYKLDIAKAHSIAQDTTCFNCSPDTSSIYYREFTPEFDSSHMLVMAYSPDRSRYVNLGYISKTIDGIHYEDDCCYDDCQEVYLTDRRQKHNNLILWYGVSGGASSAYWKNDDVFVTLGEEFDVINKYVICVFDIAKHTVSRYEIEMSEEQLTNHLAIGSYRSVYLKERNIKSR